jgi:hypothetical protein
MCQQWGYPPIPRIQRHRKPAQYHVVCREYDSITGILIHEETRYVCFFCAWHLVRMRPAPGAPTFWACLIAESSP